MTRVSSVRVPLKDFKSEKWGDLGALGHHTFEIIGEKVDKKNDKFSFLGGHRVRLYKFTKNVHFKIPAGIELDISAVTPGAHPPRRR